MSIYRTIICSFLFTVAASAAERPNDFSSLLADAPADALGVVYVQHPADLLTNPFLQWFLQEDAAPPVAEAVEALARLFDGPAAIVVTGSPLRPDLLAVTITAKVSKDPDAFFKSLDKELVGALNRIETFPGAGAIGFDRSGESAVVRFPGPMPVHVTFAFRDGCVRASSSSAMVESWRSAPPEDSGEKAKTFLDSDDFKRMAPDRTRQIDLLLYCNGRSLMPLARVALSDSPEVFEILGLGQMEAAGLTATWSGKRTTADLTVCLNGEPRALAQLFQGTGRPVSIAKLFPSDTLFLLGGAFNSAAAVVDRVNKVLTLVDPEIVREYEQEQFDFACDFGFDIHNDVLGNLVDEWALAVRADNADLPEIMLAVRLEDPGVFDNHVRALVGAFGLKFSATTHREVTVFKPQSARLDLAYGVVDNYLMIASDPAAVYRMVDAWRDHKSLNDVSGYRTAAKRFARGPSAFGYLDVSQLTRLAFENGEFEAIPALGVDETLVQELQHLAADHAVAAAMLDSAPGSLRMSLEFAGGSDKSAASAGHAIWGSFVASTARARELSKRLTSASNLRWLAQASKIYAADHGGEWPASLSQLVEQGNITLEMLGNVYEGTAPRTIADADRESYFLYRGNVTKDAAPTEVVAGEREIRHGEGANFAYADGHVEFVREPDASRLLAVLRAKSR